MAKVVGPLHSDDARGNFGKVMVFMGWKGIQTVRQWLKPTNPQRSAQGNIRTIIGGLGRAVGKVVADSAFHDQLITLDLIPDQQSKQSYLVQYIKDNYLAGKGATLTGNFATQLAALTGSDGATSWSAAADGLNIEDFSLTYDDIAAFRSGLGLYLLAVAAVALEFTGTPYSYAKAPASWTISRIHAMIADMTGSG